MADARGDYQRAVRDREAASPRQRESRRVYSMLRSAIRGHGPENPVVLVEAEVMTLFRATRMAVRDALSQLADDRLVIRRPRVGTVVRDVFDRVEIGVQANTRGVYDLTRLELRQLTASSVVSDALGLERGAEVTMAEYLIVLHGQPFCIETCYWPADEEPRTPFVTELELDLPESFFRHFGSRLSRSDVTIEAVKADEATRKHLDMPHGAPLLVHEKVLYDEDDRPRELQFVYYAANRAYFHLENRYDGA